MVAKMLQRPALVLNRNWQPVNVATVARALVLLWNESARVVDPTDYQLYTWKDWSKLRPRDDERFIQAVRFRLRVPEAKMATGDAQTAQGLPPTMRDFRNAARLSASSVPIRSTPPALKWTTTQSRPHKFQTHPPRML